MSELGHQTTQELIATVESKNRRFKVASAIFGAILTVGLAILLVITLATLSGVNRQLQQQKKLLTSQQQILSQIQKSSNQRTQQLSDLQQHIDCIVELFQQPNRSNLTITDLENCQISSFYTPTSDQDGASAPAQGAPATTNTPSTGASNKTPMKPSSTPAKAPSRLDRIPVLGRVFKALGL